MAKYSRRQRVYFLWLSFINSQQALDAHDGDQRWLTAKKNRLVVKTSRRGRKFKVMSIAEMAADLLIRVADEVGRLK